MTRIHLDVVQHLTPDLNYFLDTSRWTVEVRTALGKLIERAPKVGEVVWIVWYVKRDTDTPRRIDNERHREFVVLWLAHG